MNYIAGMILLNVQNEEDAFWCLVYILLPKKGFKSAISSNINGKHNWRLVFKAGMPKAIELEHRIKYRLHKHQPEVLA